MIRQFTTTIIINIIIIIIVIIINVVVFVDGDDDDEKENFDLVGRNCLSSHYLTTPYRLLTEHICIP